MVAFLFNFYFFGYFATEICKILKNNFGKKLLVRKVKNYSFLGKVKKILTKLKIHLTTIFEKKSKRCELVFRRNNQKKFSIFVQAVFFKKFVLIFYMF